MLLLWQNESLLQLLFDSHSYDNQTSQTPALMFMNYQWFILTTVVMEYGWEELSVYNEDGDEDGPLQGGIGIDVIHVTMQIYILLLLL